MKAIKEKLTKSRLVALIADELDGALTKKDVAAVLDVLNDVACASVTKGGVGEFQIPGLVKFTLKKRPAIKAGTLVRSPATGEMIPSAGRPASMAVKARALGNIKSAAAPAK